MTVQKLSLLPAGRCLLDRSSLDTRRPVGELANIPIWSYLIETTDGPILVDTGMPASCITDPADLFRGTDEEDQIIPQMTADHLIPNVLARAGYQSSDLLCVISTHWHFDHAGGNQSFPTTPIIVQQAEYDAGMTGGQYFDFCKDPTLRYRCVNGDVDLVPGVTLLFTPGHTRGHQSVLVRTVQSGAILLTIDASYWRGNYEDGVPFAAEDPVEAARSIARLQEIAAAERAKVFFGHDELQGEQWRTSPDYY